MSDELVKQLRANASWGDDRFAEAADRIEQLVATNEQLTAERDALGQDNHRWKMECENFWRDREKALTAERDRLREAIETISYYNTVGYTDMALDAASAALKGETP